MLSKCFFNPELEIDEAGVLCWRWYTGWKPSPAPEQLADGGQVAVVTPDGWTVVLSAFTASTLDSYANGGNSFTRKAV